MGDSRTLQSAIQGAKAGDTDSFRLLYEMLATKLFRFIRPRTKNRDDALDVLQETFIDFWKGLSRFEYQGDTALEAYLYRIASRKVARTYRWWQRFFSLEAMDDIVIDESEARRQDVADVMTALHRLRAMDQEILVLRHIQGHSFSEIAQLLGETENTLKVRHHRAMSRLRDMLDEQ